MKTNDRLERTVFVIFGGDGDLNDEKRCWHLHDGIRKFSRQGIVKNVEWDGHNEKKEGC